MFEEVNEELLEQTNTASLVTFLDLLMVTLVRGILVNLSMKKCVFRIENLSIGRNFKQKTTSGVDFKLNSNLRR